MAGTTVSIPAWPSCMDCVAWSSDSEIAVATGENIEILIPKLQIDLQKQDHGEIEQTRWERVRLIVNTFTQRELPYISPQPFRVFSLGEEQSSSFAAGLAWSPTGLARHNRCALAVLTTNHVLSIWAPDASPSNQRSWQRVLIVNTCLQEHFTRLSADVTLTGGLKNEVLRCCRIHSFSWIPASHAAMKRAGSVSTKSGQHIVLANGSGQLVVVEIQSQVSAGNPSVLSWNATVLSFKEVTQNDLPKTTPVSKSTKSVSSLHVITKLTVTPWLRSTATNIETLSMIIAFTTPFELHLQRCFLDLSGNENIFSFDSTFVALPCINSRTVKWDSGVADKNSTDSIYLACLGRSTTVCMNIEQDNNHSRVEVTSSREIENLDQWDVVGGTAFTRRSGGGVTLHYAFHSSIIGSNLHSVEWPLAESEATSVAETAWVQSIKHHREAFSDEYKLYDHVLVRTYGMASHVAGNTLATCISVHPSDMIQYAISVEQSSLLLISDEVDDLPPLKGLSSESALFAMSRALKPTSLNGSYPVGKLAALKSMFDSEILPLAIASNRVKNLGSRCTISEVIISLRTVWTPSMALAHKVLPQIENLRGTPSETATRLGPQEYLCSIILLLSPGLYRKSPLGSMIVDLYKRHEIHFETDPGLSEHDPMPELQEETCEICDSSIRLESGQWARCEADHQFARCGLTLLAIQSPGVSKRCGLCGHRYLKEDYLLACETETSTGAATTCGSVNTAAKNMPEAMDSRLFLSQFLCMAFDFCIYCGGKFVG